MTAWSGGKGSKQRPTDKKKFDGNWDRIFGNTNENPLDVYNEERLVSKYDKQSLTNKIK